MIQQLRRYIKRRPFLIRLVHWEYWPFHIVYGPIYLYWLFLCIKARSFFFFNAANPGIRNGGFLMESKKEIYDLIPQVYYPQCIAIKAGSDHVAVYEAIHAAGLSFPLIAKPDIGMRGMGVAKIETWQELVAYLQSSEVDFLIQQFVAYGEEVGIFYYRFPGSVKGSVSGIVKKEFVTVTGNGRDNIATLLSREPRYLLQLNNLKKNIPSLLAEVPSQGEEKLIVPYGNHARGAKFIDLSHSIDEELTHTIDSICRQVPGFYFGRLDIRYDNWESLRRGEKLSIIELNGAGSEPTHIYDPEHNIFFAWKEIIRHWNLLYRISIDNRQQNKAGYLSISEGIAMFRENSAYIKRLAKASA